MYEKNLSIGHYGLKPPASQSIYEDEHVGSLPAFTAGVIVSRVSDHTVFVRDWHIIAGYRGYDCLEKFEEAKHNYSFKIVFSQERTCQDDDYFDGNDPMLKEQLVKQMPQ